MYNIINHPFEENDIRNLIYNMIKIIISTP